MKNITKWYIHRLWLKRYSKAWKQALERYGSFCENFTHPFSYWVGLELKRIKEDKRLENYTYEAD